MELKAYKFSHQNVLVHPEFEMICPMASKAVYKVIKHASTYDDGDDGTANGFGDKDHQYAQVVHAIIPGVKFHLHDDKSNWRANYNVQKLYGGKLCDTSATTNYDALNGAGGSISLINFNKYFKRIK